MTSNSLDACFQLVADRRRRRVIQQLRHETDGTTTIDDLVDRLHSGGSVSADDRHVDREDLAIQLHHTTLPKLEDHGVVDYDHRSGTVRYQPNDQVETVLDSLHDDVSVANP